jgi:hypothetical protein
VGPSINQSIKDSHLLRVRQEIFQVFKNKKKLAQETPLKETQFNLSTKKF